MRTVPRPQLSKNLRITPPCRASSRGRPLLKMSMMKIQVNMKEIQVASLEIAEVEELIEIGLPRLNVLLYSDDHDEDESQYERNSNRFFGKSRSGRSSRRNW
mmetsp:Transcript_21209/g.27380  ORF Transcript_21209/g.27380 Transcript_21209/m.27380 type:complete len:102 (-) Transcript_21209:259-564(-)